jgi:hypothetical protein
LLDDSSRQVTLAYDDVAVDLVDDVFHVSVLVPPKHDQHAPVPIEALVILEADANRPGASRVPALTDQIEV